MQENAVIDSRDERRNKVKLLLAQETETSVKLPTREQKREE